MIFTTSVSLLSLALAQSTIANLHNVPAHVQVVKRQYDYSTSPDSASSDSASLYSATSSDSATYTTTTVTPSSIATDSTATDSSTASYSAYSAPPAWGGVNSGGEATFAPVNSGGESSVAPPTFGGVNSGGETTVGSPMYTSTSSAWNPSSTGKKHHGSGSMGKGGYESCIQTCKATFGGHGSRGKPSESGSGTKKNAAGELVGGPGEVIVAPKMGELRMVPFAINIPAGSNLTYIWGAGPHTVTQSSLGGICNKSTDAGAFASGQQNATFTYSVKIAQADAPTFYYCGVKAHCQMGMFGIVNPIVTTDNTKSFGSWMDNYAMNNTDFSSMKASTEKDCAGNDHAMNWGKMYDYNQVEPHLRSYAAESIMATRSYYARNVQLTSTGPTNSTVASSSSPVASVVIPVASSAAAVTMSTSTSTPSALAANGYATSSGERMAVSFLTLALVGLVFVV